jgi:hypothetical protein
MPRHTSDRVRVKRAASRYRRSHPDKVTDHNKHEQDYQQNDPRRDP